MKNLGQSLSQMDGKPLCPDCRGIIKVDFNTFSFGDGTGSCVCGDKRISRREIRPGGTPEYYVTPAGIE
jgi:hypothetical protein